MRSWRSALAIGSALTMADLSPAAAQQASACSSDTVYSTFLLEVVREWPESMDSVQLAHQGLVAVPDSSIRWFTIQRSALVHWRRTTLAGIGARRPG